MNAANHDNSSANSSDYSPPRPIENSGLGAVGKPKKQLKKIIITLLIVVILTILSSLIWFSLALSSLNYDATTVNFKIPANTSQTKIGQDLKQAGLIRSDLAFNLFVRLKNVGAQLQAGNYQLSSSMSTPDIVQRLVDGPSVDEIEVTFTPGATVAQNKAILLNLGYEQSEIDQAFAANYSQTIFANKPSGADLEGYLFGETHRFIKGTSVQQILNRFFDDFDDFARENNLAANFEAQGLNLYEGITLASIIQRESGGDDKRQIAQVFLKRLAEDIELGSDVTYQYIADKLGIARDVNLDNVYNTRRYKGLPPGPIAVPSAAALLAVSDPAPGDYLYFLSGDDDKTYFARTLEEHEANIRNHCQKKCQII